MSLGSAEGMINGALLVTSGDILQMNETSKSDLIGIDSLSHCNDQSSVAFSKRQMAANGLVFDSLSLINFI